MPIQLKVVSRPVVDLKFLTNHISVAACGYKLWFNVALRNHQTVVPCGFEMWLQIVAMCVSMDHRTEACGSVWLRIVVP